MVKMRDNLSVNPFYFICTAFLIPAAGFMYNEHDKWPLISGGMKCT